MIFCRFALCRKTLPIFLFLIQTMALAAGGIYDIETTDLPYGYPTVQEGPFDDGLKLISKWEIPKSGDISSSGKKLLEQKEYDQEGRIILSMWSPSAGRVASSSWLDEERTRFTWEYDRDGNVTRSESRTGGQLNSSHEAEYLENRIIRWSSHLGYETIIEYDSAGRRITEDLTRAGEPWGRRTWVYLEDRKVSAQEVYFGDNGETSERNSDEYHYDDDGRLMEVRYLRYWTGNESGEQSYIRTFAYDENGNLSEEHLRDATGETLDLIRWKYDSGDLLTEEQILVLSTARSGTGIIRYEYDAGDRKISERRYDDSGLEYSQTTWEYNVDSTIEKDFSAFYSKDSEGNRIPAGMDHEYSTIEYLDDSGRLTRYVRMRADGTVIRESVNTRDIEGRLLLTHEESASGSFLYEYAYY